MEKLNLKDFIDFKYISNLKSNEKQTRLAFVSGKALEEKNEYHYDLYTIENHKAKKLINLKKHSNFIWENDDTLLFAYAKNNKEEKIEKDKVSLYYRYHLNEEKLEKAFDLPMPAQVIQVIGNKLVIKAQLTPDEHQLYLANEADRKTFLKEQKKLKAYEDITEIPFYSNGNGFVTQKRSQLFIYDTSTKTFDLIVDPDFNVNIVTLSKDLKHIYYTGKQAKHVRSLTSHVFVYHLETKTTEVLYQKDDYNISSIFLLKDKVIVEASDMQKFGLNEDGNFYELKHKELVLFKTFGLTVSSSVGSDSRLGGNPSTVVYKDKLYFVKTNDDHTELITLDMDKNLEQVFVMDGSIEGIQVLNDEIYMVGLYKQKLQEVYKLNGSKLTQITRFNSIVFKNKYIAKPKTIIYKDRNHEVKGFVLYPKDFDPNKTYPAILDIHGGPKTVYGKVYYHEMQLWANLGYFVCFANPRGSDGKGNEFADIRGKYGTIDYDDLMNFTDLVIKKTKQIDVKNFFVTGGSYGGFMTNWIVGHTHRFKAAATQRSISNWLSFHGTSDIGFYFSKDQTAGHPLMDTDLLWQQSPIKYAMDVKTPLLFIHSDEDYRCPIEQAMQYYTILREKGLETKFVWFKGETHELSRGGKPQARIKRLKEITDWFETHKS
ncbi:MAG: S9 family peptidase [Acholeplasmataceae bacterium]|nr:S9 family peptidase [Acholeplasmataceae bacterium]